LWYPGLQVKEDTVHQDKKIRFKGVILPIWFSMPTFKTENMDGWYRDEFFAQ